MSWDQLAKADIKRQEGCRLISYQDGEGVWTIGYGHTKGVGPGMVCTQAQADDWLEQDLVIAARDLSMNAPWFLQAPDPVKRGLLNMSFNLGWTRLSKFSKMLACGATNNWTGMADNALDSKWAHQVDDGAGGKIGRADFVAELFRSANQGELPV